MKYPLLSLAISLITGAHPLSGHSQTAQTISIKVTADYLALHASGRFPAEATQLEYRLGTHGDVARADAWTALPAPALDGSFDFEVPLTDQTWTRLELRALRGTDIIATSETTLGEVALTLLTEERITALPESERAAWEHYLGLSHANASKQRAVLARECRKLGWSASKPAASSREEFEMENEVPPSWYRGEEAQKLAFTVISYQTPAGGWSKGVDYSAGPRPQGTHWTAQEEDGWHYCGTLDNRSTTEQIEFLAQVHLATRRTDCQEAALRGLEWLLTAQFPNGGWPQVYPLEPGYHEAVTFNDDAMVHALEVVRSASLGELPFTFLDDSLRQRAASAYQRGIACVLACQVQVKGKPSVWCAQHDPLTLAPVAARLKEPPSLSGAESAEILKFLMRKGPLTAPVRQGIQSAIGWLEAHRITGIKKTKSDSGKTDYVQDASASEVLWARFYDLNSENPIFTGSQDGRVYSTFHEMAEQNKVSYDYYTTKPRDIVTKELAKWQRRIEKESPPAE